MRIGNYEIEGINRRFWFVLGGFVFLLFSLVYFLNSRPEPRDPLISPAFSTNKLATLAQDPNWMNNFIRRNGISEPTTTAPIIGGFEVNLGVPFRFRAYIPARETFETERPDLHLQKYNWFFEPAIFIEPSSILSEDELSSAEDLLVEGQPFVLGFSGGVPPDNHAYEFTALLYWNSFQLSPPKDPEAQFSNSPVLLVSSWRELPAAELRNPTTHRYDLDLSYREAGYEFTIHQLEWAAGQELRACVSVTNIDDVGKPMWDGVSEINADAGTGSVLGLVDDTYDSGQLSLQGELEPGETVPGYIFFGTPDTSEASEVANPEQGLQLTFPRLTSGFSGSSLNRYVQVTIPPNVIEDVVSEGVSSGSSSCGGNSSGG